MNTFKWLDAYGRPVEVAKLKVEQASVATRAVRRNDAIHPAANLTPGRLARLLADSIEGDPEAYLALAEDMEERNEHYAAVLGVRKRQVAGLEISVEAAGNDAASVKHADLVREVVARDGFQDELIDILDAIGKGFSATEILWDMSGKEWRPKRLIWRDPRGFLFDPEDGETPLVRLVSGNERLNPFQWIFHQAKMKSGLPIRGGLARGAAWTFLFRAFTLKDWAIFVEAYGQPLRLGKWGQGASEEDKSKLLQALSNIGADYAAMVPDSMAIEFVKADISGSHELYERRSDWLDRQVSKLVLGQTGTTDAIAGGHAVGRVHDQVREDIEVADARQIAATLNRDLIIPLITLNFGAQNKYPKITLGRGKAIEIDKLVDNVAKLVPLGLEVSMSEMRDRLGLSDPDSGEILLRSGGAPSADKKTKQADGSPPAVSPDEDIDELAGSVQRDPEQIDDLAARMLEEEGWRYDIDDLLGKLEKELANAGSVDEAQRIMVAAYRTFSPSRFTDALARSMFAARLAGETDEQQS